MLIKREKQRMETRGFGEAGHGNAKTTHLRVVFKENIYETRQTTREHAWFRTGRARSK